MVRLVLCGVDLASPAVPNRHTIRVFFVFCCVANKIITDKIKKKEEDENSTANRSKIEQITLQLRFIIIQKKKKHYTRTIFQTKFYEFESELYIF